MKDNPYTLAGYLAIAGAVLALPSIVFGIILEIGKGKVAFLLIPYLILAVIQLSFGLYAFYRFKDLLNTRFHFHDVDTLIVLIIIGSAILMAIGMVGKSISTFIPPEEALPLALVFIGGIAVVGIPLAVLGIIYAVKLLKLPSELGGLKKPYIYLNIIACCFFVTFILAPIGMLFDLVATILMGLILLKPQSEMEAEELEFV